MTGVGCRVPASYNSLRIENSNAYYIVYTSIYNVEYNDCCDGSAIL